MSFWVGAAAGYVLRKKRLTAQRLAELEEQADSLQGRTISPPLATESWFSAQGTFTFGLPRNFINGDPSKWSGPKPSALVVDGTRPSAMWLVVVQNQNMMMALEPGVSPWIMVVQPEHFRAMAKKWGGTVVAGPEPILLHGERAVWGAYGMVEQGRENRKWVAYAVHGGQTFELIMGVEPHTESMYANAFWTAVGSWRWGDQRGTAQVGQQQPSLQVGGQSQPAGLLSPDGKHWWDGTQWRPV